MVRGSHVYNDIWAAVIGEVLECRREPLNVIDPFAVAVVNEDTTVGHVPRRILLICSLFLRKDSTILCKVTGNRRYLEDLQQGGIEIPCTLTLQGIEEDVTITPISPPNKKRKLDPADEEEDPQMYM